MGTRLPREDRSAVRTTIDPGAVARTPRATGACQYGNCRSRNRDLCAL